MNANWIAIRMTRPGKPGDKPDEYEYEINDGLMVKLTYNHDTSIPNNCFCSLEVKNLDLKQMPETDAKNNKKNDIIVAKIWFHADSPNEACLKCLEHLMRGMNARADLSRRIAYKLSDAVAWEKRSQENDKLLDFVNDKQKEDDA